MVKVYLAGSIWETDYREYVHKNYEDKLTILDPLVENGVTVNIITKTVDKSRENFEIVELDKEMIRKSDIFVAFIRQWTAGTLMEIMFAYENHKPIYIITDPGAVLHLDIWLSYHYTRNFFNIDDCFDYILKEEILNKI